MAMVAQRHIRIRYCQVYTRLSLTHAHGDGGTKSIRVRYSQIEVLVLGSRVRLLIVI